MTLNKQKGNMYSFFNQPPYRGCTWNPIKGLCKHNCLYCFAIRMFKQYKWNKDFRLDEKCMKENLGKKNYIFVGSSTDMWSKEVKGEWIEDVLEYCKLFPENRYFFQSKNPERFIYYSDRGKFPDNTILTTTIETDNQDHINQVSMTVPTIESRAKSMNKLIHNHNGKMMLTIEPIMDFDIEKFLFIIEMVHPSQINIGADSGNNKLPEPPKEKIAELITELRKFTTVHLKSNLKRLYDE